MWVDVDTAITVPVNIAALINDSDFKTIDEGIAFDEAGMDLNWNFITTAGVITQTNVTPTTGGGDYDWTHGGNGMYNLGMPAHSGASINNDAEGFGWFSGIATAVLPFSGPIVGFRAAAVNNDLIDSGTSLAKASVCTEARLAELSAANLPADIDAILVNTQGLTFKKNTAFNNFSFTMRDSNGDALTGETVTGQVSLDGGNYTNLANAVSEIQTSGTYKVNLAAADLNSTVGLIKFTSTNAKTRTFFFVTVT